MLHKRQWVALTLLAYGSLLFLASGLPAVAGPTKS